VFFQGLAYRQIWKTYWHIASEQLSFAYEGPRDERDRPNTWQLRLLRLFDAVSPLMHKREVPANEQACSTAREQRSCSGPSPMLSCHARPSLPILRRERVGTTM
jgi:hypothetical protein